MEKKYDEKEKANIPFGPYITVLAGATVNGKPDALKVKPTILMDSGYFDLNDKIGSVFKACSASK